MASVERIIEMAETLSISNLELLISELEEVLEEKRGDDFRDNY